MTRLLLSALGMTDFSSEETAILVRNIDMPVKLLMSDHSRAVLVELDNLISLHNRHILWEPQQVNTCT